MSVDNQEGKVGAIYSLGVFVEDALDKLRKELLGLEGTKQALATTANKFEDYLQVVDQEVTDGKITLTEAKTSKRHVATCILIVRELLKSAENQYFTQLGRVGQCDQFVQDFKKMYDEERADLKKLKEVPPTQAAPPIPPEATPVAQSHTKKNRKR